MRPGEYVYQALEWLTDTNRLDLLLAFLVRRWRFAILLLLFLPYACGLITGLVL